MSEETPRNYEDNTQNIPAAQPFAPDDLPIEQRLDENLDEATPDKAILANPQWGSISMLAAAASFGSVIPGAVASAYGNLLWTVELHGDNSLSNGGGTLEGFFREQFEGVDENGKPKNDEDDDSVLDRYMELAEERAERKREFDEWQRETHSFAGQDWTGEQWGEVADELKPGSAARDWLVSYLMNKKQQSKEQAEQLANDMQLAASGRAKPEADRTQAEKDAGERIKDNPVAADAFAHMDEARMTGFTPVAAETRAVTSSTQTVSVDARSEGLYDAFPSAPNLVEHHQAAVAATEPLDVKPADQIAAATPQPKPGVGAGLDV